MINVNEIIQQTRAEVLTACIERANKMAEEYPDESGERRAAHSVATELLLNVQPAAKDLEQLREDTAVATTEKIYESVLRLFNGKKIPEQWMIRALEEYVKNLPLSEIARIKGIPDLARLGKTYDRPDFTFAEDG